MFLIKIVYTSVINWECFLKGTLCVWVLCLYVHLRVIYKPNAKGGQKEYQICWNWSVRGWWTAVWLPGIEPEFSRKAASAFSHWTISPAQKSFKKLVSLTAEVSRGHCSVCYLCISALSWNCLQDRRQTQSGTHQLCHSTREGFFCLVKDVSS